MPGITAGDPSFRNDDGSADPVATAALTAFASGQGSEHAALTALASGRLLVPVLAVMADQITDPAAHDDARPTCGAEADLGDLGADRAEQATEMAMPTLIGLDGRRAVPAFTCLDALHRWQHHARPVPAAAAMVWRAAADESCAVVIDVAGPVPLAVEGARLTALARGEAVPTPEEDPDIRDAVAAALADEPDVAGFQLGPGDAGRDLTIGLILAADATCDVHDLAGRVGEASMARLAGRLRRGVGIRFGSSQVSRAPR